MGTLWLLMHSASVGSPFRLARHPPHSWPMIVTLLGEHSLHSVSKALVA